MSLSIYNPKILEHESFNKLKEEDIVRDSIEKYFSVTGLSSDKTLKLTSQSVENLNISEIENDLVSMLVICYKHTNILIFSVELQPIGKK